MFAGLSEMCQDFFVVATDILKGISKNGHPVKGSLFVDASGEREAGECKPGGVEGDRAEGIAEDVVK